MYAVFVPELAYVWEKVVSDPSGNVVASTASPKSQSAATSSDVTM
jgi:hypothetical protein